MEVKLRTIAAIGCVVALVTLLAVSTAGAGYKTGHYSGETSQGESIGFKAKKAAVKDFSFTVMIRCEDGNVFSLDNSGAEAPTKNKGKFRAVFTGDATTVVKGKLKRKRAAGTIESEGTSPSGASCSARTDWSAARQ